MDFFMGVFPSIWGLQVAAAESVAHHPGCRMLRLGGDHGFQVRKPYFFSKSSNNNWKQFNGYMNRYDNSVLLLPCLFREC